MKITSIFRSFALGLALASAAIAPVACTDNGASVSADPAKAAVAKVVADFTTAWEAQDYDRMLAISLPEPMLDQIMRQYGVNPDENRDQMAGEIKKLMQMALSQAKVITANMDAAAAEIQATPTGRKYALVPSVVEIEVQGTRVKSTGKYLAFDVDGRWYLMDPSGEDAIKAIKAVFPDLADVPMTPPKMEMVSP